MACRHRRADETRAVFSVITKTVEEPSNSPANVAKIAVEMSGQTPLTDTPKTTKAIAAKIETPIHVRQHERATAAAATTGVATK